MDKLTYLAELAEGLARWVPERERQDILRYYAEYFEEAGPGREAEVVAELGDPWALSCRLAVEGGFVSQEQAASWTPPKKKKWPWVLLGTAAVLVCIIGSVAYAASQIGRFVGGFVRNVATTPPPYAIIDSVEGAEAISGVTFIGGEEYVGGIWSMEDGDLDPFYAIDADISFGNITITSGDDFTLWIGQSGDLGGYSVNWEIQGDTLKISDGSSGGVHIGRLDGLGDLMGQKGLDVVITVPEGSYLQKVTAETDFGNVYLANLNVEVKITAKTSMGNVDGYELHTAEKVELKTDMGNVTFGMDEVIYAGMAIELKTNLGDVEANMACYEEDCEYELKTSLGQVSINGEDRGSKAKQKGNKTCKLDAGSDLGNVDVYFYDSRWQ